MAYAGAISLSRKNSKLFLLLPTVILLVLLTIYPIIYAINLSLHEWHLLGGAKEAKFVGVGNYLTIFKSSVFWETFRTTLFFSVVTVILEFLAGLLLALLFDADLAGNKIVRVFVMIPMVIAPIVIGAIWKLLFHLERGHINYFLSFVGISGKAWLSDPAIALWSVILVDIWKWTPLVMMILFAGLKAIPSEIYEAGKVDGAMGFDTFRYLTFPMLKPYIAVAVIIRLIDSFKTFDYLFILTGGGPGRLTELLNIYTYYTGLRHYHMGYASALALIMVVLALSSGIVISKLLRRE